ncbi:MAG: DUF1501 domain-containing protein [Planctomycetes bacterium]|nr:DUF1501 domain-containing protein [Planctomycetota bacterium]
MPPDTESWTDPVLNVGRLDVQQCGGRTRRAFLQAGALGAVGVSLADLLRSEAHAAEKPSRPKSVILLWLWGGPSHLDTFDLKPKAPTEYRGPYAPISTNVDGIRICELLPRLAKRADKYTILRSLHHTSNDHGIAGTIGLTGSDTGATSLGGKVIRGSLKPAHGSVVSRVLGFSPAMPRFVALGGHLHQGHRPITGEGGGSLGKLYDPFRLDYDPEKGVNIPQLELIDGLTRDGLTARRKLLARLDGLNRKLERSTAMARFDQFYQQAFSLLTSSTARAVFDLDLEPEKTRRQYGRFRFGQCCLMARRMIEAGSRFVQVNWSSHVEPIEDTGDGGWDMHDRQFQQFQDRHSWMIDQSLSALLDDLSSRGMLDDTIVVAVGEFGRTPKINGKAGRDHWHQCYSGLVAGGGIRGGRVIGSSDKRGEHPASHPVTPADLFGTILSRIGIGTTQLTSVGLSPQGNLIEELF